MITILKIILTMIIIEIFILWTLIIIIYDMDDDDEKETVMMVRMITISHSHKRKKNTGPNSPYWCYASKVFTCITKYDENGDLFDCNTECKISSSQLTAKREADLSWFCTKCYSQTIHQFEFIFCFYIALNILGCFVYICGWKN